MIIKEKIIEITENFRNLADYCVGDIEKATEIMISSLRSGGKIMFCGNGGSAADSQHLAAELTGRYLKNREPLAALALTTDTSAITAIGNDYSFDEIFARQVNALGDINDTLYAISTSGKSVNVIRAIQAANDKNLKVIGVTGNSSAEMQKLCDLTIKVPARRPDRIQEMHIAIGQIICEQIENEFFNK